LIWVPGCLIAGWWQVTVALSGNDLAYLYSVEWPVFAVFGVVAWWHFLHDDRETVGIRGLRRARERAVTDGSIEAAAFGPLPRRREEEDAELAAYNDYLERLSAESHGRRS
jgi:hypothetical protein